MTQRVSTIQIRQFEQKDQDQVVALFIRGLTSYGIEGSSIRFLQAWFCNERLKEGGDMTDIFSYYVKDETKNFWVAFDSEDDNHTIIGLVGAFQTVGEDKEEKVTELVRMSVSSEIQSKGIGSMLCKGKNDMKKISYIGLLYTSYILMILHLVHDWKKDAILCE